MRHAVAVAANLIDFLDEIGVEVLVRFQHFEETAMLDAFFHLFKSTPDRHMAWQRQLDLHLGQFPLANGGLKHREQQKHAQVVEIVEDRSRVVKDLCRSKLFQLVIAAEAVIPR